MCSACSRGPTILPLSEEFLDDNRKTIPAASNDENQSFDWIVNDDFTYAALTGVAASAFLQRIAGRPWLYLHGMSMTDGNLSTITIRFPVNGSGDYQAQVAAGCPTMTESPVVTPSIP